MHNLPACLCGRTYNFLQRLGDSPLSVVIFLFMFPVFTLYAGTHFPPGWQMVGNVFSQIGSFDLFLCGTLLGCLGWSMAILWSLDQGYSGNPWDQERAAPAKFAYAVLPAYLSKPFVPFWPALIGGFALPLLNVFVLARGEAGLFVRLCIGVGGVLVAWALLELCGFLMAYLLPGVVLHPFAFIAGRFSMTLRGDELASEKQEAPPISPEGVQPEQTKKKERFYGGLSAFVRQLGFPDAYFVHDKDGKLWEPVSLHVAHVLMFSIVVAHVGIYVGAIVVFKPWADVMVDLNAAVNVPHVLTYLLFFIITLSWMIGASWFFLNQVRLAGIGGMALACLFLWMLIGQDHKFRAIARSDIRQADPAKVVDGSETLVVVATYGGGIQAAAWTAKVLTELDKHPEFSRSLRLISGVSGGSVGASHFVAGKLNGAKPENVVTSASTSSLGAISCGLIFDDLPSAILHKDSSCDRGVMMERAWRTRAKDLLQAGKPLPSFFEMVDDVEAHRIPALILNSAVAETGQSLAISHVPLDHPLGVDKFPAVVAAAGPGRGLTRPTFDEFSERYRGYDLDLWTAARLSATFPFASPESRMQPFRKGDGGLVENPPPTDSAQTVHLVDGGYFDNSGMVSAVSFIRRVLEDQRPSLVAKRRGKLPRSASTPIERVVVVEIMAFPDNTAVNEAPAGRTSFATPLGALLQMRTTVQQSQADLAYETLKAEFDISSPGHGENGVRIRRIPFKAQDVVPVLSWHLTERESSDIVEDWKNKDAERPDSDVNKLLKAIRGTDTEPATAHMGKRAGG